MELIHVIILIVIILFLFFVASKSSVHVENMRSVTYPIPDYNMYQPMESPSDTRYVYYPEENVYLLPFEELDMTFPYHRWMYYHYPSFYSSYYSYNWPFNYPADDSSVYNYPVIKEDNNTPDDSKFYYGGYYGGDYGGDFAGYYGDYSMKTDKLYRTFPYRTESPNRVIIPPLFQSPKFDSNNYPNAKTGFAGGLYSQRFSNAGSSLRRGSIQGRAPGRFEGSIPVFGNDKKEKVIEDFDTLDQKSACTISDPTPQDLSPKFCAIYDTIASRGGNTKVYGTLSCASKNKIEGFENVDGNKGVPGYFITTDREVDMEPTYGNLFIESDGAVVPLQNGLGDNGVNGNGLNGNESNENGLNGYGLNGNGLNGNGLNGNGLNGNGLNGNGLNGYGLNGPNGNGSNGNGVNGNGSNGNVLNSNRLNGNRLNGNGSNGNGLNGNALNGNGLNGNGLNGNGLNGNGLNGNGLNGNGLNGNGLNGNGLNGNGLNGSNANGLNGNGLNGSNAIGLNGNGSNKNGLNGNGLNGSNAIGLNGNVSNKNGLNGTGLNRNGLNGNGLNGNGLNGNGLNGNGLNGNGLNGNRLNGNGLNGNGLPKQNGNKLNGNELLNGNGLNELDRNGLNGNGLNRNGLQKKIGNGIGLQNDNILIDNTPRIVTYAELQNIAPNTAQSYPAYSLFARTQLDYPDDEFGYVINDDTVASIDNKSASSSNETNLMDKAIARSGLEEPIAVVM